MGQPGARARSPREPESSRLDLASIAAEGDSMPAALDAIVAELSEADRQERIELLIDFAKNLPPLPERLAAHKDASHRVEECQSPVYLFVEMDGDRVALYADAPIEAPTVRGFVSLLVEGLNGATVEEVLKVPGDLVERIGLPEILGMLRVRGLSGVLRRIKAEVTRAAMAQAATAPVPGPPRDRLTTVAVRRTIETIRDEDDVDDTASRWRPGRSCLRAARCWSRSTAGPIALFNVERRVLRHRRRLHPRRRSAGRGRPRRLRDPCPRHGARFDVRTGKPLCMPAVEPVATHQVEVRGDDIFVVVQD